MFILPTFAQTVHAALYTGNLAGRPIGGDASTSFRGLAYGKFNGVMVLLPAHCRGPSGTDVYGPTGTAIGYWTVSQAGWPKDLTYIELYSGNWPCVQNIVYSNNGSGGFTIVTDPSSTLSCANHANDSNNVPIYEAWQSTSTSTCGTNNGITQRRFGLRELRRRSCRRRGNHGSAAHHEWMEGLWRALHPERVHAHSLRRRHRVVGQSRTCSLAALRRTHRTSRRRKQHVPLSHLDMRAIAN